MALTPETTYQRGPQDAGDGSQAQSQAQWVLDQDLDKAKIMARVNGEGLNDDGTLAVDPFPAVIRPPALNDPTNDAIWYITKVLGAQPSGLSPKGNWDASTNTPDLTAPANQGETLAGQYIGYLYNVQVAGTQDLGAGAEGFEQFDQVYFGDGGALVHIPRGQLRRDEEITADPTPALPRVDYAAAYTGDFTLPDIAGFPSGYNERITLTVVGNQTLPIKESVGDGGVVLRTPNVDGQTWVIHKPLAASTMWTATPQNAGALTANNSGLTAETEYNIEGKWLGTQQRYTQTVTWTGTAAGIHNFAVPIDSLKVIKIEGITYHAGNQAWPIDRMQTSTTGLKSEIPDGGAGVLLTSIGSYNPSDGGHATVHYYK